MRLPSSTAAFLPISLALVLLLPRAGAAKPPVPQVSESERLHRFLDLAWESKLRETPEFATYIGFPAITTAGVAGGLHAESLGDEMGFYRDPTSSSAGSEVEVNRYISSPDLGLAYKIGELMITELRATAQEVLGPAFDPLPSMTRSCSMVRLPLDVLEQNVKAWMLARKTPFRQ